VPSKKKEDIFRRVSASTGPDNPPEPFDLPGFWQHLAAVPHPGPAPDVVAAADKPGLSRRARRALLLRAVLKPLPIVVALVPAALAFAAERPMIGRLALVGAAIVLFVVVRWLVRRTAGVGSFTERARERRALWQAALARWAAEAGPRRFDNKRAELEKLKAWWTEAVAEPQQRARIEAAIRRGFGELQQIADQIHAARVALWPETEEAYHLLLQAELDLETVGNRR
jgi:hypothetical protein